MTPSSTSLIPKFKLYGTPLFCAPEVRSKRHFVGPEGDIYALGLMLYEMNLGGLPDMVESAFFSPGGTCKFDFDNAGFSNEHVKDLCRQMLCPDPEFRPSIETVQNHIWLTQ